MPFGFGARAAVPNGALDLGPVDAAAAVTATLWLKSSSDTLATTVADRQNPASPRYHQWLSPADIAAQGPTAGDVATLTRSLTASGLTVSSRGDTLRVTGSAAAIERAFGTDLRTVRLGAQTFRAATATPTFTGAGRDAIAGITGLTTARMTPYAIRATNLVTGKSIELPLADAADPSTVFTDVCFGKTKTVQMTRIAEGGAHEADITGPQYKQTGLSPATATCGYTPAEVAAHYGLAPVYAAGDQGQGQTIVLVDAYGSPTIQSDANTFSKMMGLPALGASNFSIVYPDGPPIANPYPTGWPVEISLDVEWAHAIAPKAKLVLVVAPSDDAEELSSALNYAVKHQLGTVISNSYGYPEADFGPATADAFNQIIKKAAAEGIAVDVSTGDSGDDGLGTPQGAASTPADSPYATGIGGTSLGVPSDNGPVESAWGHDLTFIGDDEGVPVPPYFEGFTQGGGGGESAYLEKPRWQSSLVGTGRLLPDISAVADPFTGGIIVTPNDDGSASVVEVIGGTSLSSPVFSGIWALADQEAGEPLGQAAPIISRMPSAAITDIVPLQESKANTSGTVGLTSDPVFYTPAGLLDLTATQPNGFLGTVVQINSPGGGEFNTLFDLGFGADSSLMAYPGWDDATGYGVPNGLAFVRAAAAQR